jgi:hypothetical protein
MVLCAMVLTGAIAGHVIRSTRAHERRLVLDCMAELGWETAAEDATTATQLEQSRAWCEGFVKVEP